MGPDAATLVPFGRVAVPLGVAALAEVAAWALALSPGALDPGWYARPALLAAVHALTVGTLAVAITGAGWQIVPVLAARPHPVRSAPWVNAAVLLGAPLLLWGLARPGSVVGHVGATLAVGGLVARGLLVAPALLRARLRPVARAWLAAAELSLLVGLGLALALYAGRAGHPVLADPLGGVELHAALLLAGWAGGWFVGAGGLLLPMFAIAAEPRPALLAVAGAAWFGGLVAGVPALWGVGAVLVAVALGGALWRGARAGAPLRQALAGVVGLVACAAMAPFAPVDATVACGLTLAALPVLRGVAQRIVPFLAWTHAFGHRPRGAPPASALLAERLAGGQAALSLLGGVGLVAARLGWDAGARPAAALLLAGALLHVAVLAVALLRTLRLTRRRDTIAGLEAR